MRVTGRAVAVFACCLLVAAAEAGAPQAHRVVVDEHPLRVWEKAPPQPAARMLLVHGRTWSTRPDFDLQVPAGTAGAEHGLSLMDGLIAADIGAWGVDLRGYGETPRDDSGWLTPDRAVADVIGVLAWLGERTPAAPRPYLFGWSYGAMVAQLVAQRRPDLISGLILFGYPVRPGIDRDPEGAAGPPPRQPTTAAAARSDFIVPGAISQTAIEAFVTAAVAADPVRMDWRGLDQWRALDGAEVRVPTLLLEGHQDPLAQDDVHARLFTRLDTADKAWVVIPRGDHAAFMEAPRGYFLQQLTTFVLRGR